VPQVLRHANLLGELGVRIELPVDRGDVSLLEPLAQPVHVTAQLQLAIGDPLADLLQLVRDCDPLVGGARAHERDDLPDQGQGEGPGIVDSPGHLDRLVAEPSGAFGILPVDLL
jgi:hypothetical protein